MMAGHVAPEAADGGPIALLRDGDIIRIDVPSRRLDADVDLAVRAAEFTPRPAKRFGGVLGKYVALVSSASEGAITRPPEAAITRPPEGVPKSGAVLSGGQSHG
jgi:dihydroxy-acid dehydratase